VTLVRVVDFIEKKRTGQALTDQDIHTLIRAYVDGEVPDYQMSAFAMAVCWQGMTDAETAAFTMAMAHSGQMLDLADIPGIKVDKHSTGGVGDTTTLVLCPLIASLGIPVAKMSGRGLGHTGGTIDKLESIPGLATQMQNKDFIAQVRDIGIAVAAQTQALAPADKSLYALRDVTGTVASIPLIASSIMSKKLASGADAIVLDVKVGDGAFMKDMASAQTLARAMVAIGARSQRQTVAVLSNMAEPLGFAVGNALEVREAIATLQGRGPVDLTELCLALGAQMVVLAGQAENAGDARRMLEEAIADGRAAAKLRAFIAAQGGDANVVDNPDLLPQAPVVRQFRANQSGFISGIRAQAFGEVAMRLGAGRSTYADVIDPSVGLVLHLKTGDMVAAGDVVVEVHAATELAALQAIDELASVISISQEAVAKLPGVLDVIHASDSPATPDRAVVPRPLDLAALSLHAQSARTTAYVPYSHFAVGAALQLADGRIVTGSNVENASYGLTNCAERTAIFSAVAAFGRSHVDIVAVAVAADSEGPVAPCGACRQVLAEFCSAETPVVLNDLQGNSRHTSVGELLPYAFGPMQMRRTVE